jgi:serine/threonine protein kinase
MLQVAIKVMPKQRGKLSKARTLEKLIKEVGILQRVQDCPNVVRLLGTYEGKDEVMVVTELCEGGDLQKLSDVSVGVHSSAADSGQPVWQQQQQ